MFTTESTFNREPEYMSAMTENEITRCYIKALREGSYEAFNAIYNMYVDKLYGFVFSHTKSQHLSEDIVQEVFIRLWNNRKSLSEKGSLKAMLFIIGRNLMIDAFRSQINKVDLELYIGYIDEMSHEEEQGERLSYDDFMNALEAGKKLLSDRQLQIYEMNKEKGQSIGTIAESLKLSEQTVKNTLGTSIKKIRKHFHKYTNYI